MTKIEFLKMMDFPLEWEEWGMYRDELFEGQISRYIPGNEMGAEHDRNEAFHWWLKKDLSHDQLKRLTGLAIIDPDKGLGADVCAFIEQRSKT